MHYNFVNRTDRRNKNVVCIVELLTFIIVFINLFQNVFGQIAYKGHLSDLRIQELHSMAIRLERSINPEKYACESYYDYVCSFNRPLYTVLGHLPETSELIQLLTELQNDSENFEAKEKLMDFFISCNSRYSLEDCYRQSFEYFKPVFGYIITKNHVNASSHEHRNFIDLLNRFITKTEHPDEFGRHPIRLKLISLKSKFRTPYIYFRPGDLNHEYRNLRIYRESYQHNLKNLELHRKRNSTYEEGIQRTMLDWTLYLFQSRNKPMSYYYPTLSVHLWMSLYNSTERLRDLKYFTDAAECLKLPQFVTVLDEARVLAVVYLKSFRESWKDYHEWIASSKTTKETFEQERGILRQYNLNNEQLFFTLYAQNFCDFGKELSENVFYLGMRQTQEFFLVYGCGYQSERVKECV